MKRRCCICDCEFDGHGSRKTCFSDACRKRRRALDQQKWAAEHPDRARDAQLKYRSANHEKVLLHSRERYAADPEKSKAATQNWRKKNPEAARAQTRKANAKYFARYPERVRAQTRSYNIRNPEKIKGYWQTNATLGRRYQRLYFKEVGEHISLEVATKLAREMMREAA